MVFNALKDSIVNLDFEGVQKAAQESLKIGMSPIKAIKGMSNGMEIIGEKFDKKEIFLSELVIAAEVMKEGMEILEPHIKTEDVKAKGKMVIGTVAGDLHDIGKNIVVSLLRAAGFEVVDLGIDVPMEKFVDAVKEHNPQILGMSALLTITMSEMASVIKALEQIGVRQNVKVIVGGAPVTEEFAQEIGADHAAADAVEGVNKCRMWVTAE